MPECPSRYRLVRFDTGLLCPDDSSSIELHLRSCKSCRESLKGMRDVFSEFNARLDSHQAKLRHQIRQKQTNKVSYRIRAKLKGVGIIIISAALATAAVVFFALVHRGTDLRALPSYELDWSLGEQPFSRRVRRFPDNAT